MSKSIRAIALTFLSLCLWLRQQHQESNKQEEQVRFTRLFPYLQANGALR